MTYLEAINDPELKLLCASIPRQAVRKRTIKPVTIKRYNTRGFRPLSLLKREAMTAIIDPGLLTTHSFLTLLKTRDRRAKIVQMRFEAINMLHQQGYTPHEIASFLRRDRSTISYVLIKLKKVNSK